MCIVRSDGKWNEIIMIEISNATARILMQKLPKLLKLVGTKDSIRLQNDKRMLLIELAKLERKIK